MPTEQQITLNLIAVENAMAQQWLEGLEPSRDVIRDLQRVAQGEITIDEVITNISQRTDYGKIYRT